MKPAMARESGRGKETGPKEQGLEGAILQDLARARDIVARLQELLPDCCSASGAAVELVAAGELAQEIFVSVSRSLSVLTTGAGGEAQAAYHPKSRRRPCVSCGLSGVKRTFAKKLSSTNRGQLVHLTTQIMKWPLSDDGFTWKKYGQKKIKCAKYPRSYFRCSRINSSFHCPAVKLVQQTDNDVPMFTVSYIGRHTCQDQLLDDEYGLSTGVAINFTSRSLETSNAGTKTSLCSSPWLSQWRPTDTKSEVGAAPIIDQMDVDLASFGHIHMSPSRCPLIAPSGSCEEDDNRFLCNDSPARSPCSAATSGEILEGLWLFDDEDFLLT